MKSTIITIFNNKLDKSEVNGFPCYKSFSTMCIKNYVLLKSLLKSVITDRKLFLVIK